MEAGVRPLDESISDQDTTNDGNLTDELKQEAQLESIPSMVDSNIESDPQQSECDTKHVDESNSDAALKEDTKPVVKDDQNETVTDPQQDCGAESNRNIPEETGELADADTNVDEFEELAVSDEKLDSRTIGEEKPDQETGNVTKSMTFSSSSKIIML